MERRTSEPVPRPTSVTALNVGKPLLFASECLERKDLKSNVSSAADGTSVKGDLREFLLSSL